MDPPDPREDLVAGIESMRKVYDVALAAGATEERLEEIRKWIYMAADMLTIGVEVRASP